MSYADLLILFISITLRYFLVQVKSRHSSGESLNTLRDNPDVNKYFLTIQCIAFFACDSIIRIIFV